MRLLTRSIQFTGEPPLLSFFPSSEYYFSDVNLAKDVFIRQEMDSEGFVPVSLIAAFPRMEKLTKDVDVILEAVKDSTVVETKEGKVSGLPLFDAMCKNIY